MLSSKTFFVVDVLSAPRYAVNVSPTEIVPNESGRHMAVCNMLDEQEIVPAVGACNDGFCSLITLRVGTAVVSVTTSSLYGVVVVVDDCPPTGTGAVDGEGRTPERDDISTIRVCAVIYFIETRV